MKPMTPLEKSMLYTCFFWVLGQVCYVLIDALKRRRK